MPSGNEASHVMDGLTVRGGIQIGDAGPYLAPNTNLDPFNNPRPAMFEYPPRLLVLGSTAIAATQQMRITYWVAPYSFLATTMEWGTTGTAAGATPTLVRYGLYSVDQVTQNGTLVASTANDTALLAGTNTRYPKAFSTPVQVVAGNRYASALLVVTGAALPTIPTVAGAVGGLLAVRPYISATLASQTDLPATFTDAGVAATTNTMYFTIS
jgi:hypothetical protein